MKKGQHTTQEAKCPSCGEPVELEKDVQIGDIAYCVDCDQELKVLKINPPRLKAIAAVEAEDGLYTNDESEADESPAAEDDSCEDTYDEDVTDADDADADIDTDTDDNGRE